MRRRVIVFSIGVLLFWGGSACSDPGDFSVFHNADSSKLGIGMPGGVLSSMDVTRLVKPFGCGFSIWRCGLGNGMSSQAFATAFGHGDRGALHTYSADGISPGSIGWGSFLDKEQKWELAVDLGVVLQIPPEVEMSAAGRIVLNAPFEEALLYGEKQLGEQLDDFNYYPALFFGLRYRF